MMRSAGWLITPRWREAGLDRMAAEAATVAVTVPDAQEPHCALVRSPHYCQFPTWRTYWPHGNTKSKHRAGMHSGCRSWSLTSLSQAPTGLSTECSSSALFP